MNITDFLLQFFTYGRYAAELGIMTFVFSLPLKRKKNFWKHLTIMACILGALVTVFSIATPFVIGALGQDFYRKTTYVVYFFLTLPTFLFAFFAFDEPFTNRAFIIVSIHVMRNLCRTIFSLITLGIGTAIKDPSVYLFGFANDIWLLIYYPMWGALVFLFYYLLRRFTKNISFRKIDSGIVILLFASLAASFALSALQNHLNHEETAWDCFLALMAHLIFLLTLLGAQFIVIRATIHAAEKEIVQGQIESHIQQFDLLKENMDLINEKAHDLRHQLRAAKLASGSLDEKFMEDVENSLRIYDNSVDTGNPELDMILVDLKFRAAALSIPVKVMADGKCLGFMDRQHVITLFSNLFENALNYEKRLLDESARYIQIQVGLQHGFVHIAVENPLGQVEEKTEDEKDPRRHGFGLLSMKRIVGVYDGVFTTKEENGVFKVSITIPCFEESFEERA